MHDPEKRQFLLIFPERIQPYLFRFGSGVGFHFPCGIHFELLRRREPLRMAPVITVTAARFERGELCPAAENPPFLS